MKVLTLALGTLLISNFANATTYNLGQLIANNGSFTVGDKTFSGFALTIASSGSVGISSASDISIGTIGAQPYGITIGGPIFANAVSSSGAFLNLSLSYFVDAPAALIRSIVLETSMTGFGPGSFAKITETATNVNPGGPDANAFVSTLFSDFTDDPDVPATVEAGDQLFVSPYAKRLRIIKDITVLAGAGGFASATTIIQRYNQVPEPSAYAALLAAGLGFIAWKRRQRQQA